MAKDLYAEVTQRIVEMLEAGVVPWRCPILGKGTAGWPKSLVSGKKYRGVNVFLLALTAWSKGYSSSCWLTFNQARDRGGSVKKGEKSSLVVFWKWFDTKDQETGEAVRVPVLRHYNVFNAEQCNGIEVPDVPAFEPVAFTPIEQAERIVSGYEGGPKVEHGGSLACYLPLSDLVRVPEPERFISAEAYYSTLFHELAHSTGHSGRLNRGIDVDLAPFGSPDYGKEELVAEMAAAFLSGTCGIQPATIENSAAYVQGWIKTLKGDKRLAVHAAGAAQKAADGVQGVRPGTPEPAASE